MPPDDGTGKYSFTKKALNIGVNEICLKPTPVTTVTKIWKFEYKIITSQLACDAVPYTHDRKAANIKVKYLPV